MLIPLNFIKTQHNRQERIPVTFETLFAAFKGCSTGRRKPVKTRIIVLPARRNKRNRKSDALKAAPWPAAGSGRCQGSRGVLHCKKIAPV